MATWIPVIVAVISALLAGWFAAGTKRSELRAQRLLEIERRTATSKGEIWEPLVDALGLMWDQARMEEVTPEWYEEHVMPTWKEFMKWVQIYGSDEAVWLVHRYMQAVYADAPVEITMRLMAEVTLAARRELANPETKVTVLDILGFRLYDIYSEGKGVAWADLSERDLYKNAGWVPPWGDRFRYGKPVPR